MRNLKRNLKINRNMSPPEIERSSFVGIIITYVRIFKYESAMKNEVYYRVRLLKTEVIDTGQGNQWDIYSGMADKVTVKNSYDFETKDKAMNHLNGFLKRRPETEKWIDKIAGYEADDVIANYECRPNKMSLTRYNAIVEKVDMGTEISEAIKFLRDFGYKVVKSEE